jgi:hypothetical protein
MGESKQKKRAHAAILEACPHCIYCGATATTIDHVPPRIMFWSKRRPKGLEFPCCNSCNHGTRLADMVAALISRTFPDARNETMQTEVNKLFKEVNNNVPGLLEEMHLNEADRATHRRRLNTTEDQGGYLRANGPLVSAYMQTFGFKTGFAFYYEATKKLVPKGGAVAARWFSNVERMTDQFPPTEWDFLLPAQTLRQGKFEVSDQFAYQWRLTEDERMGVFVSYFRQSFSVVSFVAMDKNVLSKAETTHSVRLCEPGEITKLLPMTL